MLQRQLTRRFGPLSEEIHQRLKSATLEQLELWADRILDAGGLEQLFQND